MNNKGISEIISQILLLLITVIVIGIIIGALVPQITRSQSRLNFEESKRVRDNIYSNIQEVYNSPIGYTKEVKLSLENLTLVIDADTNTIEVYSLIDGDFYKDGLRQDETSEKYTYRKGQKVYAGFTLSNINLARSYVLENVTRTSIYLRKTDKEKITVLLENITEDSWFTSSNLGLYTENPSTWQYRKKILLDGNKVDGNLTNFPVLIYLEDPDLRDYANADGNDIMFTLGDGKTKLKREIESFGVRNEYEYRKKITIDSDKVEEDLTDFPMLVSLLDSDLKTYAQSDGRDIYFTASDGETRLKREIESFEDKNLLRKKITIDKDKVDGDLTDFPMLVSVKDSDLKNYAKEDGSDIFFTLLDGTRLKREIESFEDVNTYRKKITIDKDKVDEDLTDFPVFISLTDSNLATFAKADGSDIYFTLPDGTRLKREIEDYNSVTGALISWVKIPNLSSTVNTDIYINFGDEDENNSNDVDVWDEDFVGVYLFNNNVLDSSIYGNHATLNNGSYTYNSQFGKSLSFNANNTKLELPNNFYVDTNRPFSILTRFKSFGYNNQIYQRLISLKTTSSPFMIGLSNNATYSGIYFGSRLGEFYLGKTETIPEINVWHNLVWIYLGENATNSDNYLVYLDGNLIAHTPISGTPSINDNTNNLIGSRTVAGDIQYVIDGELLNFKISNNIYSESWIKTEYNNQSAPETFSSVGELETITTKELIAWIKIPELSSEEDTEIYMYFGDASENNTNDTDVWDENFVAVWHKNDYNSTTILDSTTNNITGTKSASPPLQTTGKIGNAQIYDNQHISIGQNILAPLLNGTTGITVTAWIKPNTLNTEGWILFEYITSTNVIFTMRTHSNKTFSTSGRSGISDGSQQHYSTATLNENEWQYIVIQADYTNTKQNTYYNGIYDNNSTPIWGNTTLVTGTPSSDARIGNHQTAGRNFDGIIDELRVSKIVRSSSWIKTEYNNQSAPEEFYSVGNVEEVSFEKELIAWVKIPNLSSTTNTEIYINFGDEDENNSNDTDVWDSNYVGVWHKNDLTTSTIKDSTINNRTNTKTGTNNPLQTIGKIGFAQNYNGTNSRINTNISNISYEKSTISFWANFNNLNGPYGNAGIIFGSGYWQNNNFSVTQHSNSKKLMFTVGPFNYTMLSDAFSETNTWNHYTFSYDSTKDSWNEALQIYVNGENRNFSSGGQTTPLISNSEIYISSSIFFGLLDEIRFSNNTRSANWIKTEYNNQSSPETFSTIGELETITTPHSELFAWVKIPELTTEADTPIYIYFGNENANEQNDKDVWSINTALVQHFNDNVFDSTIYANNGTPSGSPIYIEGINGKAMYFDGINDHINLGTKPINSPLQMREGIVTVSHWIKPDNYDYSTAYIFLGSAGGGYLGYGTKFNYNTKTYASEVYGATGERQPKSTSSGNIFNLWKHFVVVLDGINNHITFFVNGNQISQQNISDPGDVITTYNFIIGSHSWTGFYKGTIDELRVYNTGLSQSWIKTEYINQSTPAEFIKVGILEKA